jgi:hypothetical protein
VSQHSTSTETGAYGDHSQLGKADAHGHLEPTHGGSHAVAHVEREQPSDWGWNAEMGKWASRAGWITVLVIGALFFGITHYNRAGFLAQAIAIGVLVVMLLWDRNRKRTSWRD